MSKSRADTVQPIPEGNHTITPWNISRDSARLIAFLTAVFGAEEIARVVGEDGSIGHAEVRIGDMERRATEKEWGDAMGYVQGAQLCPSASGDAH